MEIPWGGELAVPYEQSWTGGFTFIRMANLTTATFPSLFSKMAIPVESLHGLR